MGDRSRHLILAGSRPIPEDLRFMALAAADRAEEMGEDALAMALRALAEGTHIAMWDSREGVPAEPPRDLADFNGEAWAARLVGQLGRANILHPLFGPP